VPLADRELKFHAPPFIVVVRGSGMLDEAVVVHFADGRTLSGYTDGFLPDRSEIVVRDAATNDSVAVQLSRVKIVCFVRDLASTGVVRHREAPPIFFPTVPGRRAELVFKDGERMGGIVNLREEPRGGFYLAPLNPNANNIQVYVNPSELASFRFVT
jgi:hypothetical protein